jgi:hypothetical protein
MHDVGLQACSPRAGKNGRFLPRSFQAIIRSASSLASTVRSAGSSVVSTITSNDEDRQCEPVIPLVPYPMLCLLVSFPSFVSSVLIPSYNLR